MPSEEQPVFRIALVLAGAVSAGAYTAGVLDFLIEALDAWEAARGKDPILPQHRVELAVLAGSSAGGMTAAIAAAALGERFPPGPASGEYGSGNPLYRSWVQRIDIAPLLEARDLTDRKAPVRSVLDSTVLEEIANEAIRPDGPPAARPWVADELHVLLALANLRGVPYRIAAVGERPDAGHPLTLHADNLHFIRAAAPPATPGAAWLDPSDPAVGWPALRGAGLATGAFPLGLAPRALLRPAADYGARAWRIPMGWPAAGDTAHRCWEEQAIAPAWGAFDPCGAYNFSSIDGGLLDNEPLELARRVLEGSRGEARAPGAANRATILVDPFPEQTWAADCEPIEDLAGVAAGMFSALRNHARFKPEELVLAQSKGDYSRFLIAPVRHVSGRAEPERHAIASGMLGAFGGFLSERMRHHDFVLGRRNCQKFLRHHFVLPAAVSAVNPVLSGVAPAALEAVTIWRDGAHQVPLIPLVGSAAVEVQPAAWEAPWLTEAELARLEKRVFRRLRPVTVRLTRDLSRRAGRGALRLAGRGGIWFFRGWIAAFLTKKVMGRVRREVAQYARGD